MVLLGPQPLYVHMQQARICRVETNIYWYWSHWLKQARICRANPFPVLTNRWRLRQNKQLYCLLVATCLSWTTRVVQSSRHKTVILIQNELGIPKEHEVHSVYCADKEAQIPSYEGVGVWKTARVQVTQTCELYIMSCPMVWPRDILEDNMRTNVQLFLWWSWYGATGWWESKVA